MDFFNAPALLLLIIVPIALLFLLWRGIARSRAIQRIGNPELIASLIQQVSPARRRLNATLWLITLIFLIFSLARPIWGVEAEVIETDGVAVMLVLDISRSMDAQDISPSRIGRAKLDMGQLIQGLEGQDVGITLFAGESFVYMPFTYDTLSALTFLDAVSTRSTSNQGTALYAGLQDAVNAFENRNLSTQKVVVLASDGENHQLTLSDTINQAIENNVIVHTLGYGTEEGGQIPLYDENGALTGFQTDSAEAIVTSGLDETELRAIASDTGGIYQQVTAEDDVITPLLESIGNLETSRLGEQVVTRSVERFGLFVLFALLALSLEMLLPENRQGD